MDSQSELFKSGDVPAPAPGQKLFRGANGIELPYWEEGGKIIRVALSDELAVHVTKQKGGHIYANVPGFGRLDKKSKISFLSAAALVRQSLEIKQLDREQVKRTTPTFVGSLGDSSAVLNGGRRS